MRIKHLTVLPHDEAPDVLCGPDGMRIFIGGSTRMIDTRTAVATRIVYALRLAKGLSNKEIESILEAQEIYDIGLEGNEQSPQPLEQPQTLTDAEIRILAQQHGFTPRKQDDGHHDFDAYVFAFARDAFRLGQQVQS